MTNTLDEMIQNDLEVLLDAYDSLEELHHYPAARATRISIQTSMNSLARRIEELKGLITK